MIDCLRNDFNLAQIIVVDDNSPDRTWELVQAKVASDSRIKLIRRFGKRNLVSSLHEGICNANGDIIIWLDCDFSMPQGVISELIKGIDNYYDIAVGSRYIKGGEDARDSKTRVLTSRFINKFAKWLLRSSIYDLTSEFIASRRHVFNLRRRLANEGIETRSVFIPMHLQPIYYKRYYQGKFPVSEELCRKGICLPSGAMLKKNHIALITGLIKSYST